MQTISSAFKRNIGLLSLLIFSAIPLHAQQISVHLIDEQNQPIIGAHYSYNNEEGVSSENGNFEISFQENTVLIINSLGYKSVTILPSQLRDQLELNIPLKEVDYGLSAVTVLAVNHSLDQGEQLKLSEQDYASHDGGSILNKLPEISGVRKSASYGFDPVLRGYSKDQLNIVLDGSVKAISACPNRMDPPTSQMAPNMIEKVDIYKGPFALRFGNSFGATINYKSPKAHFSEENKWSGRLSGNYNQNGKVGNTEGAVNFSANKVDMRFFGSYGRGDNYVTGNDIDMNARFNRISLGMKSAVKLNKANLLDFSLIKNRAKDTDFPALMMDLRSDNTWLANGNYKWLNFKNSTLASIYTQGYFTQVDHVMDNLDKTLNPRMVNAITNAKTKTYGIRSESKWAFNNSSLLYVGLDLNQQEAQGKRKRQLLMGPMAGKLFYDNIWQDGKITESSLFGEFNKSYNAIDFVLSGRISLNQAALHDPDKVFAGQKTTTTALNPNISAGIIKPISSTSKLSFWLGRAQRSGSLSEKFTNYLATGEDAYELLGNPNLKPESNNQFDIQFNQDYEQLKWQLNLFSALMTDYIQGVIQPDLDPKLMNSPGVRKFENIGNATKFGGEFALAQEISKTFNHQVNAAYTWAKNNNDNAPLAQIAPFDLRYHLKAQFLDNKLKPTVSWRYVAKQNRISKEFGEKKSPSFNVFDFETKYNVNSQVSLKGGVNNILDKEYYEFLNRTIRSANNSTPIYSPGRSFYLSFALDF